MDDKIVVASVRFPNSRNSVRFVLPFLKHAHLANGVNKARIVITTRTSARHMLSMSKQIATACTKFRMFGELALAFPWSPEKPRVLSTRTSDINALDIRRVRLYSVIYMRIRNADHIFERYHRRLHVYTLCA